MEPGGTNPEPGSSGRVLVVDDEPALLRSVERVLKAAGYAVTTAADGGEAVRVVRAGALDAVVSDISMPGTDGLDLLRYSRSVAPDVPVILMTGAPSVETAVKALDYGAYKYLLKPVSAAELTQVVHKAIQMGELARLRKQAVALARHGTIDPELRPDFTAALADLWMAFQPIIGKDGGLFGYEALMRVQHARLRHPGEMLDAAEKLGALDELGRRTRGLAAAPVAAAPEAGALFVNLHPEDLHDSELMSADSPLARIADRVILEITERRSISDIHDLRGKVQALRRLGYRIAVDDLGAGYAGLGTFALLEPDIVKIDMSLVRGIDQSPMNQKLLRSLSTLCREMNIQVVGEGIETEAEHETLVALGCDLFQGYLFAKPSPPFPPFKR